MKIVRLENAESLCTAWPFLVDGFREPTVDQDSHVMFRVLSSIIAHPESGWAAIAKDNFNNPIGFVVLHDSTAMHDPIRTFTVRALFVPKGRTDVANALLRQFEAWARRNRVSGYTYSMKKFSGAATRYMKAVHRGLQLKHMTFERQIA